MACWPNLETIHKGLVTVTKIILSSPGMENIQKNIKGPHVEQLNISWDLFPDGTPNTTIKNPQEIKGSDVYFLADFNKPEEIFRQLSVIYALPHYGAKSLTIFLPYFPTASMERVDSPGRIATAKTLMRMLDAVPACHGGGPARLITYDIHSLAVQHFHGDGIIVELQSAVSLLQKKLRDISIGRILFAFPDEGAQKRFHTFFPDSIVCTKNKDRTVKIIDESSFRIQGAHVIVIDDMVRNGDTILNCQKALMERGAAFVSVYVTHGVFPQETWKKFKKENFRHFWVTDSCLAGRALSGVGPFEVLSLTDIIEKEILL